MNLFNHIVQDPDFPNFTFARTIRLRTDEEMSKSGTICVQTLEGSVYTDVIVTSPIRGFYQLPYTPADENSEGELLIIGFLDASFEKPFLVTRCADFMKPSSIQLPRTTKFLSESIMFIDDGKGSVSFSSNLQNTNVLFSLSSGSTFNKYVPNESVTILSLSSFIGSKIERVTDSSLTYKTVKREIQEKYEDKIKKLESEIEEMKLKWKKIEQEGDELKEKIKKVEKENDSLKEKVKQYTIEATTYTLDCNSISLGGKAPADAPVLFNQLNSILMNLLSNLSTMTVTCPPLGGPSSPPLNFAAFTALQGQLINLKSKFIKID